MENDSGEMVGVVCGSDDDPRQSSRRPVAHRFIMATCGFTTPLAIRGLSPRSRARLLHLHATTTPWLELDFRPRLLRARLSHRARRCTPSQTYDSATSSLYLFGGRENEAMTVPALNDLWRFSLSDQVSLPWPSPVFRLSMPFVHSPPTQNLLELGRASSPGRPAPDSLPSFFGDDHGQHGRLRWRAHQQ